MEVVPLSKMPCFIDLGYQMLDKIQEHSNSENVKVGIWKKFHKTSMTAWLLIQ
jgi:hypothetical protein